ERADLPVREAARYMRAADPSDLERRRVDTAGELEASAASRAGRTAVPRPHFPARSSEPTARAGGSMLARGRPRPTVPECAWRRLEEAERCGDDRRLWDPRYC